MSNSRQFLVPSHYDINKTVYPKDEIVRKRQYLIDELKTTNEYRRNYVNTLPSDANYDSTFYADKLRRRANY